MKKILRPLLAAVCAAALVLCGGCGEQEQTYPDHTEEFYVNDFADVISDKDAEEMISAGAALDTAVAQVTGKEHGAQVVAVTVDTTDGEEISEYAFALGNNWGVGQEGEDNGVLILLATEDREVFVAVGDGLGGVLPDSKTGRFIDLYAGEYFSENEFSAGMLNLYRAIVREIYGEYAVPVPENVGEPQAYVDDISAKDVAFSWAGIAILAVIFIFLTRKNTSFMPFGPNFRGPHGGFGGFGGFGGGGGGFGGFSGGGGSFGGGGAGRSF